MTITHYKIKNKDDGSTKWVNRDELWELSTIDRVIIVDFALDGSLPTCWEKSIDEKEETK